MSGLPESPADPSAGKETTHEHSILRPRAALGPRSSVTRRVLGVALICLSLVLVTFLGSAQTTSAQDTGQDCYSMIMYPGAMPGSTMGAGYSQVIEIQNKWQCCYTYPIVLTVSKGTLPAGLMLTQATDVYSSVRGALSGTTVAPGAYNFTIHAKDSGGDNVYFCDGNYTVVVDGVNQAPSFTSGGDVTMVESVQDQPFSGRWASNMSPGGSADVGQTVTFHVSNDNNALFSV
jgi:hypothetical protein